MEKINVVVFFGGCSPEYSVSLSSASGVVLNLDRDKYNPLMVGITQEGCWYYYRGPVEKLLNDTWHNPEDCTPAALSPNRGEKRLLLLKESGIESLPLDIAFPVLHGCNGEDGTIQGLCTLAGIPFVGPGVAASAVSMDKSLTKLLAAQAGVRQAAYAIVSAHDFRRDPQAAAQAAASAIGSWPVFVKPCSSGSSVGVAAAQDEAQLLAGLEEAFRWDAKVLVEEFIDGQEIEVAVLGNLSPTASLAGEIAPAQEFYTFDAKYRDDSSKLYIPARIPDAAMETVRAAAVRVYQALGCEGLSRVDFFCTRDTHEIVFNEINTIPGFTSISMYPKLFAHEGIGFTRLLDLLIGFAAGEGAHG